MIRMARRITWLPVLALVLAACGEGAPTDPVDSAAVDEGQPLAATLPDLAPEAGTAGTDRYVPTLERVLRHAVRVVKEKRGEEAAGKIVDGAQAIRAELRAAREAGDREAFAAARRKLEAYSARVGLRVFGERLPRRVAADAGDRLKAVTEALRAAHDAGEDVSRYVAAVRNAQRHMAAAREAWEGGRPVPALVHAATALDMAHRLQAALD